MSRYKTYLSKIQNSKKKKIMASLLLHALGDTIGFKNSEWEFGIRGEIHNSVWEKVYDFIKLGGINYVPGKNWRISDDTLLHLAIAESLLEESKNIDSFNKLLIKKFLEINTKEFKDPKIRCPGNATIKSFNLLIDQTSWKEMPYDKYSGGSGASMRTPIIGLFFDNQEDIIKFSIESSRLTHNNVTGYLGGFVSAYFTHLANKDVPITEWPYKLMDIYHNKTILKYIKSSGRGEKNFELYHHSFFAKWKKYIDDKFDKNKKVIKRRASKNLVYRSNYYYENFGFKETIFPGGSGDDSVIIAYDCLLDSDGKWEKLVFYAMLHAGDTDTTGCIAGSLYGIMYGFGDVPRQSFNHLEKFDQIIKISENISKK
jgi:ADP-ribosylarginine hydrolase